MPTHLNSVTGVPVCIYVIVQPLRGDFHQPSPMSRTTRHLSSEVQTAYSSAS